MFSIFLDNMHAITPFASHKVLASFEIDPVVTEIHCLLIVDSS